MAAPSKNLIPAVLTLLAVIVAIIGAFLGSGAAGGTPVNETAGGWLTADATPIAPAGPAFSIWSVIYTGLAVYAVWQLSPAARRSERQRVLRPWAVASALLNALWLVATQVGQLWLSVLVIVALLAVLIRILLILMAHPSSGILETILVDGTFGLYLGWVCVATAANTSSWLASAGAAGFSGWTWAATALLVVVGVIGVALAVFDGGRIAPALSLSWGLAWVAVGRSEGQFESAALVWTAALVALVVLGATVTARLTRGRVRQPAAVAI